jgi:F420-non-reducing hydrogenase large subunit
MSRVIPIVPMTRLEGHGEIEIFQDAAGVVTGTRFFVPDFKGFEIFCQGRAAEEMPTLTEKICGVCPTAHHLASCKALDALFQTPPPPTARLIRELMLCAFVLEDHLLHFYFLGGPDLFAPDAIAAEERNVFGLMRHIGEPFSRQVLAVRQRVRAINAKIGGSPLYPVCGLAGGVSQPIPETDRDDIRETAREAIALATATLDLFHKSVMGRETFRQRLHNPAFRAETYCMGFVDKAGRANFYDGQLRIIDPEGRELALFSAADYLKHLAQHLDPESYVKPLYLSRIGWKGITDGCASGLYRVGPLARINVASGMATRMAQAEYERFMAYFGGPPVHHTLAYHWARLIEVLAMAETMAKLAEDPLLTGNRIRTLPGAPGKAGIGVVEAPRGTLIHHYQSDDRGIIRRLSLLVATQHNAGAIALAIDRAARGQPAGTDRVARIRQDVGLAYRAFDPCLACAAH